jgi:myo-inositol-1(or 4)-monophosphatase
MSIEPAILAEIEREAVGMATLAGAEIASALGGLMAVKYKGAEEQNQLWRDPVSEVDSRVEELIRQRLAERFPDHDVIGEEFMERPAVGSDFVWAVDPIDGTTNFVNGFPLCAATIGVLYRGRPIAGAIWCSTSHALRAGVYHAAEGGTLWFDNEKVVPKANPAVRRRLAGVPHALAGAKLGWETRKTGSAAIECAFVAAGLLEAARFETPNLWDVAGGAALVLAGGGNIFAGGTRGWEPLDRFTVDGGDDAPDLRSWKRPLILGRVGRDELLTGFAA